ncbi:UNVERIFIED_CONTAM: hypothetical protein Slati_0000800 [Sesamum latifolium]|uniref:Uncharacterized protein n=1 Tax=Sesamum latifolium TaxID=2727402 RepID=A0AAW2Y5M4_9LAMI
MTNNKRRPTLKELQEKVYPFPDSDVPYIFDELLERKLIELPESKRPDEAESITTANNRHVSEVKQEVKPPSTITLSTLQFGSFEPIQIEALFVNEKKEISIEDGDGWTLVTRRRRQRQNVDKFHPSIPRKPRLHKHSHHAKARNKTETMTHQRLPVTLKEFFPEIFFERNDKAMNASPCTDRRQPLVSCCATLSFTDEDLLLGSKPHNRPLFVLGFVQEQKVNRMLIDGGSVVNIMPRTTMKKLGITSEDLSRSRLTIQGFDQGTQ